MGTIKKSSSICGVCGSGEICTSSEQQINKDGACENSSRVANITNSSSIDILSNDINGMKIFNNNETLTFGADSCASHANIMSNKSDNCKDGASTKLNDVTLKISNCTDVSVCANCGKSGSNNSMNTCNKCKMVKYCNAACKKKHRSKHKKQCERRVAELMIKNYSNNLHNMKIAQFVSSAYLHYVRVLSISPVVEKLYAVDVFMHLSMITKAIKLIIRSVHFVELQILLQTRS